MNSLEIKKMTIKEVKSWNSSYQHQMSMPQPQNLWESDLKDADFKKLAEEVVKSSKINDEYLIADYFKNKPEVKKARWDMDPKPKGASPAREDITIEFCDGKILQVGEYPIYNLSPPFDKLYLYVKSLTPSVY